MLYTVCYFRQLREQSNVIGPLFATLHAESRDEAVARFTQRAPLDAYWQDAWPTEKVEELAA
jgi:hypothetical protein